MYVCEFSLQYFFMVMRFFFGIEITFSTNYVFIFIYHVWNYFWLCLKRIGIFFDSTINGHVVYRVEEFLRKQLGLSRGMQNILFAEKKRNTQFKPETWNKTRFNSLQRLGF